MGEPRISPTAATIITLLNNIDELIVVSNKRKEASDVMRALTIYADNLNFGLPKDKINNFQAVLLDSRPMTLSYILQDIAASVIEKDK